MTPIAASSKKPKGTPIAILAWSPPLACLAMTIALALEFGLTYSASVVEVFGYSTKPFGNVKGAVLPALVALHCAV